MSQIIYVVEDDENIRELIVYTLKATGFEVLDFENATDLYKQLKSRLPDLILLDIMLSDQSGFDIIKFMKAKEEYCHIPVIFLTAKTSEIDKVQGLDLGADDYISKPFGILELVARVKAVLRRVVPTLKEEAEHQLVYKNLLIDTYSKQVFQNNQEIKLTYTEYELLEYLIKNQGIVVSREMLLNMIWGNDFESESRTVDVHIRSLRHKLGDNAEDPMYIATIRGYGYKLLKG